MGGASPDGASLDGASLGGATLDGATLADALPAGIYRLFAHTDHLNRINVFPVPDGDTGTKLAMTMSAVLGSLDGLRTAHAGELLVRVADAAIDGARGNSGAILAQFLHGVADSLEERAMIGVAEFAAATETGARYARDAVIEPREGTLLTVFAALAAQLQQRAAEGAATGLRGLFADGLPGGGGAVDRTRTRRDVLGSAEVIDAGAAGFVLLVEGMRSYFATGEFGEVHSPPQGTDGPM